MGSQMKQLVFNLRLVALACFFSALGGCAHSWIDAEGNRHVLGFMHLTLDPIQPQAAAETIRMRTVGLTWTNVEPGNALILGYGDTTLGFLRNNVCASPYYDRPEASR